MSATTSNQIKEIAQHVEDLTSQASGDQAASPALLAVVGELRNKARQAIEELGESETDVRETIIELEQASDSAKRAAQADPGLSEDARKAVLQAHDALCGLKTSLPENDSDVQRSPDQENL